MSHYFLAVSIPNDIQVILSDWAQALKPDMPFRQWTAFNDYHITLAFLGAAKEAGLHQLDQLIKSHQGKMNVPNIHLNGIGIFGAKTAPRVLWAGVQADESLFGNQKLIASLCETSGFSLDKRPYRPHITLAKRWNGGSAVSIDDLTERLPQNKPAGWRATAVDLYQVCPGRLPRYRRVKSYAISGGETHGAID